VQHLFTVMSIEERFALRSFTCHLVQW